MSVVTRIRTSEELTVPFTPEEIWGVLAAASAYPHWWPVQWPAQVLSDQPGLLGSEIAVRPLLGGWFRFRFEELHEPFAMRLRFFGGRFEGPGGFLLQPGEKGQTRIRYDIDVFARGMGTAAVSQVLPLDAVQRFHMRSVLRNLEKQVRRQRKAAEARLRAEAEAARVAAEEEARRLAEAEATRLAAEVAERRRTAEQARLAAEAEMERLRNQSRLTAEARAARVAADARRRVEAEATRIEMEGAAPRAAEEETRRIEEEARAWDPPAPSAVSWLRRVYEWFLTPEVIAPEAPAPGGDTNFTIARNYLSALSSRPSPKTLDAFLAKDLVRVEYPHRFLDRATSNSVEGTLGPRAREAGRFATEALELTGATGGGSQVAMEIAWSGRVGQDAAPLVQGQELDARLAVFLKFHDGRIVREHVYACFEPWSGPSDRARVLAERAAAEPVVPKAGDAGPGSSQSNFEIARSYRAAMNAGAGPEEVAGFFAEDGILEEFPNIFAPGGVVRTRDEIGQARGRDLALFKSEYYELCGAFGGGSQVAMEIAWTGVIGSTTGSYSAGQKLEGRLAVFLKFRDGLIVRQRSYRCMPAIVSVTAADVHS